MAISLRSKVDFLFKKIGFSVTRTDSDSLKGATNESIASPLIIRGDLTWNKSGAIPVAIPGSSSSIVEVYGSNNLIQTTMDGTASTNRTWLTGQTNWIMPEFGSTYQVKVYVHNSNDSDNAADISKQVFASGSGNDDEWYFDYSAGVLHFMGENLPNGVNFTGKSVYISGARYVGPKGLDEFVPNAMNESDQAVVSQHTREINNLRLNLDSDYIAFQEKISSIVGIGDSDLTVAAELRNEVDALRSDIDSDTIALQLLDTTITILKNRVDSDESQLQILNTYQKNLKTNIDSDFDYFNTKIANVVGMADSDYTVVATLRNNVDNLRIDRDSDFNYFNDKISASMGVPDSDLAVVATLRNEVNSLKNDRDSDSIVIQNLKLKQNQVFNRLDSDTNVLQSLRIKEEDILNRLDSEANRIESLSNILKSRLDSDENKLQSILTEVRTKIDSDFVHFSGKVNESIDSDLQKFQSKINVLYADRDSDTVVIQNLNRRLSILEAAVGVTPSAPDLTPIPTDSETLGTLQFSTDSDNTLEESITVTWRVKAGDGASVTVNTVLFAKGMTDANVLQILYINIIDHPVANRYWEVFALRNANKIEYAFKEKYSLLGYTLTCQVVKQGGDNAVFVNTVPAA
tara:strand:- start:151 stop:2043 length:1893 start_codon:yes stop_codon:yes gene_type:complete